MASISFAIIWGLYSGWRNGIYFDVWSGIVAGIIVGLSAAVLARIQENRVAQSEPVLMEERLLRQDRANYGRTAGQLYLTTRRLIFEGYPSDETAPEISTLFEDHHPDQEGSNVSVPLLEISKIDISRAFGMIPARLEVTLASGRTEYFETVDLKSWVEDISDARQHYLDEPRYEDEKLFPVS